MKLFYSINIGLIILIAFLGRASRAETVEIPIEELPTESVMANLDNPSAVINRLLSFKGRFMTEITTGWILDEPFYENQFFGVLGEYCFNEMHGIGLHYMQWWGGLSSYATQFSTLNFNAAAGPTRGLTLFYENRLIYGKLSIGKENVFPTTFRWFAELGAIDYSNRPLPVFNLGLGNMLYLGHGWGFHLDVRFMVRQIVDPLSQDLTVTPARDLSEFSTVIRYNTGLELGSTYIF